MQVNWEETFQSFPCARCRGSPVAPAAEISWFAWWGDVAGQRGWERAKGDWGGQTGQVFSTWTLQQWRGSAMGQTPVGPWDAEMRETGSGFPRGSWGRQAHLQVKPPPSGGHSVAAAHQPLGWGRGAGQGGGPLLVPHVPELVRRGYRRVAQMELDLAYFGFVSFCFCGFHFKRGDFDCRGPTDAVRIRSWECPSEALRRSGARASWLTTVANF